MSNSAFTDPNPDFDSVSLKTFEMVQNALHDEARYADILEEFCFFVMRLHREAVTKSLSRDERVRHLNLVNAKLAQLGDRIGLIS